MTSTGLIAAGKATMKTTPLFIIALLGTALLFQIGCMKPVAERTKDERIAAIDAILNAAPTGRSGDADQRTALRAERMQLTGSTPSRPIAMAVAAKPQQATPVPQIVGARNSQASTDADWKAATAAMDARSQKTQDLNSRHWRPGLRDSHGNYISQRRFQQSVNGEIERLR
jgi:hypothetical protein